MAAKEQSEKSRGMYTRENPGDFRRKLTVDLAVVGGGMAGVAAAVADDRRRAIAFLEMFIAIPSGWLG